MSSFFWLVASGTFFYGFFILYFLPKIIKVITLRKFVVNFLISLKNLKTGQLKNLNLLGSSRLIYLLFKLIK